MTHRIVSYILACLTAAIPAVSAGIAAERDYETLELRGSVVGSPAALSKDSTGVWSAELTFTEAGSDDYAGRYVCFVADGTDTLARFNINPGAYRVLACPAQSTFCFDAPVDSCRISVFGSSVANGQGAPHFRGYAHLFGKLLAARYENGTLRHRFTISGVSVGGNTTAHLLNRYDDLIRDFGKYVVLGLSMGNEGLHRSDDKEALCARFASDMRRLIDKARADGKIPVVVNNYTHSDYDEADYAVIRQINLQIHSWDVPSVNVLGAIDDGHGRWAEGYVADAAHPDASGHKEFMHAIVPSLFDALAEGKPQPVRDISGYLKLNPEEKLVFAGEDTVHSFSVAMRVRACDGATLLRFDSGTGTGTIATDSMGRLSYCSPAGAHTECATLEDGWHDVVLTHYHARGLTLLYVDSELAGSVPERLVPGRFDAGGGSALELAELAFWRSALNADEVAAHSRGEMLKSSLEIYTPMHLDNSGLIANKAQSTNNVRIVSE